MDLMTIFSAFLPVVVSAGQQLVQKYITPETLKPQNVADYVAMQQADVAKMQAINALEGSGATYQWVEAIRKLQRPMIVMIIFIAWYIAHTAQGVHDTVFIDNMAAVVGFYLFGERSMLYLKK